MLEETFLLDQLSLLPPHEVGLAVLGNPIKHSVSPQIHNAALKVLAGMDSKFNHWNYRKIEVSSSVLPEALPRLAKLGFRGINLTIPHKVEVLPLLSSIDEQAKIMGAVNTLNFEKDGWKGYNTDGIGLARAIKKDFDRALKDFNVLILGAGGAARAATAQCVFDGCKQIAIFNRSINRANELRQAIRKNGIDQEISVLESLSDPFCGSDLPILVINATSLGLSAEDPSPINLSLLRGDIYVYDMIYNPSVTQLLIEAEKMGYRFSNGLGMLVGQAARSLEIWSGKEVCTESMNRAAVLAMSE